MQHFDRHWQLNRDQCSSPFPEEKKGFNLNLNQNIAGSDLESQLVQGDASCAVWLLSTKYMISYAASLALDSTFLVLGIF